MLGIGLHGWEQAMIASLAFAGVAAVAVGVCTWAVVRLTREENASKDASLATYQADAGKLIADAQSRAATANERAERLKKSLAWREVSTSQRDNIKTALAGASFDVSLTWVAGDAEGSEYAQSVGQALREAGLNIVAFSPMAYLGNEPHGLNVNGNKRSEVKALAEALRKGPLEDVTLGYAKEERELITHLRVGYRKRPALPK